MHKTLVLYPQSALLSQYVDFYLFLSTENHSEYSYTTFANSNFCLGIYKENVVRPNASGGNSITNSKNRITSCLFGNYKKPNRVSVSTNLQSICINFKYTAIHKLTSIPINELLGETEVFERIFGHEAYQKLNDVFELNNPMDMLKAIEQILLDKILTIENKVNVLDHSVRLIEQKKGQLKINDLLNEVSMSRTKFYTLFKYTTGQSAKDFIETIKFRNALRYLNSTESKLSLTKLTYELGYTDQSQFIHSFKKRSGKSPLRFKKDLKGQSRFLWSD